LTWINERNVRFSSTVFTERNEHLRRYAWNILESTFNAKLVSLSIRIRLNALG
jgi:argonaute-like protein implicated in RNA metabolism and viral defense